MAKTASATKKAATKHTDQPEIVISPTLRSGTSSKANASEQAAAALPALGEALAGPVAAFREKMLAKGGALTPDEVEVRLGLSFEGGTKWAIVATVGATVDVTVKWKSASAAKTE